MNCDSVKELYSEIQNIDSKCCILTIKEAERGPIEYSLIHEEYGLHSCNVERVYSALLKIKEKLNENMIVKNDKKDGKLRWELLPLELIEPIVQVFTFGAKKYSPWSWNKLDNGYERYKAALMRHMLLFEKGEFLDKESGLPHLAHVLWNAMAMYYFGCKDHDNNIDQEARRKNIRQSDIDARNK